MQGDQFGYFMDFVDLVKCIPAPPPQPNEWVPVIAALVGGLFGSLSGPLAAWVADSRARRSDKISVTGALVAEVRGIVLIAHERNYLGDVDQVIQHMRASDLPRVPFEVQIPPHYNRVYQSLAHRLGSVDPTLAAKIVQFHQLIDAVVQDVVPGGVIAEGAELNAFLALKSLLENALGLGAEIVGVSTR